MKIIQFPELYEADYNLCSLFAMRQHWRENSTFKMKDPRKTNCLLYFCGCSAVYTLPNGRVFEVEKGSVVYIPEGAVYETRFFGCDTLGNATVLIEFSLLAPDGEHFSAADGITVLRVENDAEKKALFSDAVDIYSAAVVSVAALKSVVYRLLTDYSRRERRHTIRSNEFGSIAKGIIYLESETEQEKSISEIADMCHVSVATFRRLFGRYAGVSPMEYRNNIRIERAKRLLLTGTMTTAEVALATGFKDPAYFCRVFKKVLDCTPKEFVGNTK